MGIKQRGKSGIYWISCTVQGERVRRSTGTTDKRKAEEFAAALASDLWRVKRLGEAPRITWDDAVIEWLAEHSKHRKSIADIKRRLVWCTLHLRGTALQDITSDVIRDIADKRKAQLVDDEESSNGTVNRHIAEISKVLHYAHVRGWLKALPHIPKRQEGTGRFTWLTYEQAETLLNELPEHLRVMATFALATGLRETNVRLLEWQQIDLNRSVAWFYPDQTKPGKSLNVPLNPLAVQVLRSQLGKSKRWVFPVSKVDMATRQRVEGLPTGKISNHAWRKACIRAGLPTLRFHDLRHTWASWHAQAGTPPQVLKELGGWASLAMVEKYAHLGVSHVASWASNIGTNRAQVENVTEAKPTNYLGWLMGLEPTTTGITKRSGGARVIQINNLAKRKTPKTG